MIDYEDLLRRYIEHVGQCEGVTFIAFLGEHGSTVKFTPDEVAALERLDEDRGVKPGRP